MKEEIVDAVRIDSDVRYDDAIRGYVTRHNQKPVFIYDYEKLLECIMRIRWLTYDEAISWIEREVKPKWQGPRTPMIFMPLTDEDLKEDQL